MRKSVTLALLGTMALGGCERKVPEPAAGPAPSAATVEKEPRAEAPEEKRAAPETAVEAGVQAVAEPADDSVAPRVLTKEQARVVRGLEAELEAAASKLAALHEKAANFAGPKRAAAEKDLEEVDAAHVNIRADLLHLREAEESNFENTRRALQAGIRSFREAVNGAETKMTGKAGR